MSTTRITVVTGAHPRARASVASRIARRRRCTRIIVGASSSGSTSPIEVAAHTALDGRSDGYVVEVPAETEIESAIGAFDEADDMTVTDLVCVVDAASFFADLLDDDYLAVPHGATTLFVARALRLVQHIEHASTILVTGWEEVETRDLSVLLATLSHLAPAARLRLDRAASDAPPSLFSIAHHQPGWVHLLNDEHRPHMNDIRVSAFRYEQVRPFHPGRLHALLDERFGAGEFGAVLRSCGFCRLATRPGLIGRWDQVGQMISLEPLAPETPSDGELLSIGQDIGVIGIDLDTRALTAALDDAVLSDREFTIDIDSWSGLPDPFPAWVSAVRGGD